MSHVTIYAHVRNRLPCLPENVPEEARLFRTVLRGRAPNILQ